MEDNGSNLLHSSPISRRVLSFFVTICIHLLSLSISIVFITLKPGSHGREKKRENNERTTREQRENNERTNAKYFRIPFVKWFVEPFVRRSTGQASVHRRLRTLLILWSDWMHSTAAHLSTACYARLVNDWLKFRNEGVCGQLSVHLSIYPPSSSVAVFTSVCETGFSLASERFFFSCLHAAAIVLITVTTAFPQILDYCFQK